MFRKALAVQQSQAFSYGVEVCSVQHPLWLAHKDRRRELGYVCIGVYVGVCLRVCMYVETRALSYIYSGCPGSGHFSSCWRGGEKHWDSKGESSERGKQASLLSSWLSRGSLYTSVGVLTLVWGRAHFLTGQQDSQKEKISPSNMGCFTSMYFIARHSAICSYKANYMEYNAEKAKRFQQLRSMSREDREVINVLLWHTWVKYNMSLVICLSVEVTIRSWSFNCLSKAVNSTNWGTVETVDVVGYGFFFFFPQVGTLPRVGEFQQEDTAMLAHQCASFSSLRNRRSTCDLICFLKIGYSGLSDQQGHVMLTEGIGPHAKEKQSKCLEKPVQGWRASYIQRGVLCFPADVS